MAWAADAEPEKKSRIISSSFVEKENKNLSNLKLFISHGTVDQVIPVDWARKAEPFLQNLGLEVMYKEYPIGHGVAPQNFYDFKNWLENSK